MTDQDMSYLYTIGGYAAVFGFGYAAYCMSTRKADKRATSHPAKAAKSAQAEVRKEDRKKKQRLESFALEAQGSAKAKANVQEVSSWPRPAMDDTSDDGIDNREFARQLAKAKEGKKFASKTASSKQKEKSVKQSRANRLDNAFSDGKPSDAGADADAEDDQSPIDSPEALAADVAGVSDMLEPAPAGPSVLRITDADKINEAKAKVAKAPQRVETKKQRQNRKKAEAAKEVREEAEKERKALEEKQRRAARVAEGRAAKDGSQFTTTNGASSWANGAPNGSSAKPSEDGMHQIHEPLDTQKKVVAPAAPLPKETAATDENTWMSSLPSEEEQMEMLKNEDDEWSTVQSKTSKKGKKSIDSGDDTGKRPAAQPQQAAPVSQKVAKIATSQSFGSFSALQDDAAAEEEEEEEEEEWDV